MSQKLLLRCTPLQLLLVIQCLLITYCHAYPYLILPSSTETRRLKRAFDRFDNSGVFSFGAKRFDRFDEDMFSDDNGRIFKRSISPFIGVPAKKAFDRMDNSDFFGAKRKRAFDRMGGSEFGLMKRSAGDVDVTEDREQLINDLAESIMALRRSRSIESATPSVVISYDDKK